MKKTILCIAALMILSAFAWTIFAHAGDLPPIALTTAQVKVSGDVNGDKAVDLQDVVALSRHLAGGWNETVNEKNADVNGDKVINLKDVVLLRRYLAGGWDVTLAS